MVSTTRQTQRGLMCELRRFQTSIKCMRKTEMYTLENTDNHKNNVTFMDGKKTVATQQSQTQSL